MVPARMRAKKILKKRSQTGVRERSENVMVRNLYAILEVLNGLTYINHF